MATGYPATVIPVESKQAQYEDAARMDSAPPPYSSTAAGPAPCQLPAPAPAYPHPHQPQYQQPPLPNQPQMVVLTQPQAPQVKPGTVRRRKRAAIICGVVELIHALAMLILGVALIRQNGPGMASPTIFVPVLTIVTGILSIVAGARDHKPCLIAGMVMAIITAMFSGGCFIFSAVMCGVYSDRPGGRYNYYSAEYAAYRSLSAMFGVALALHLVVAVTCIVQSGFACSALCRCCHQQDPMSGARYAYIAQPGQNGQLVFGGQAMQVIDLGRQNVPQPVIMAAPTMP